MSMRALHWIPMLALALAAAPEAVSAHGGHAEAPSTATGAIGSQEVQVTTEARANLGLAVAAAELRPIATTLTVIGEIATAPNRAGTVASRIAGRVVSVAVAEGDTVRRGQTVVEVESLLLGDPPPRARYASPLDGVVIDRHVVAGDSVEPNTHLLEVADLREVLAIGRLFEGQIGRVAVGQPVQISVPSFPDGTFTGEVERVGGALDPTTRSLPVYVRVQNAHGQLRPGMRAELVIVTNASDAALAVPRSAVLGDFGALFVFREREDDPTRFERVAVVTGASDAGWIEIVEGLLPGDRVVTSGNYSLQFLPAGAAKSDEGDKHHAEVVALAAPRVSKLFVLGAVAVALVLAGVAFRFLIRPRRGRS